MSARLPWYKRNPDRWRSGTYGMSFELRGIYSECLDAMWDSQGQIPKDVEKLSVMLRCNPRSVRKLIPQLLAIGKLIETSIGYYNKRMMLDILGTEELPVGAEFEPNSSRIHAEFESNSSGIHAEFESNAPKNPVVSTRVFKTQSQKKSQREDAQARDPQDEVRAKEAQRLALNPSAAYVRPTSKAWELDGSLGLSFRLGKLSIDDAAIAETFRADFPGIDLVAVCNRAGDELAKGGAQTFERGMAAIRRHAQFAHDDRARSEKRQNGHVRAPYTPERGYQRY
jgi:uncharacterized protein YdaU (DUF1376 family)